jgi:hypothetical protein
MAEAKRREKLMAKMKEREENLQHMQNYNLGQGAVKDPEDLQRFVYQQQRNLQGPISFHTPASRRCLHFQDRRIHASMDTFTFHGRTNESRHMDYESQSCTQVCRLTFHVHIHWRKPHTQKSSTQKGIYSYTISY